MQDNNIYIIQNNQKVNLVSIYTSFLRSKLETESKKFQMVSIKDKFQKKITLEQILEFDTTAQSLTVDTKKYISKMISKHNNEHILELYKDLPELGSYFDELNDEQRFVFSFLRSIVKSSDTIIIEKMDQLVNKNIFQILKKSIVQMAKENNYNFIIESDSPEFWSDICSYYVQATSSSVELTKNKLGDTVEKETEDSNEYQIAL